MTTLTASQFYFISKQFFKVFGKHAILPLFMRFGLAAIFIQFSFGFRLLFLLYLRHECLLLEGNKVTATTSCHAHPAPPASGFLLVTSHFSAYNCIASPQIARILLLNRFPSPVGPKGFRVTSCRQGHDQ